MDEWSIRQTTSSDRGLIDRLLSDSERKHLHLDWLDPAALTDRRPFLLAGNRDGPIACLAAPPDSESVAWLRAFAVRAGLPPMDCWGQLWPRVERELAGVGIQLVAAMAIDAWFGGLLRTAGFRQANSVVFLEYRLNGKPAAASALRNQPEGSRPIVPADLERVLALDAAAFGPLWRLSPESMQAAFSQASNASLIEIDGAVVGYQITTSSPFSVHLARLAVHPDWQRRGLGRVLVGDSIQTAASLAWSRLSVNTQADNAASLALYQRLGFQLTGQSYPVFTLALGSGG